MATNSSFVSSFEEMSESTADQAAAIPAVMCNNGPQMSDADTVVENSGKHLGPDTDPEKDVDGERNQEEKLMSAGVSNTNSLNSKEQLEVPEKRSRAFESFDVGASGDKTPSPFWEDDSEFREMVRTAPKQFWQVLEYTRITEERVLSLEMKVKALQCGADTSGKTSSENRR